MSPPSLGLGVMFISLVVNRKIIKCSQIINAFTKDITGGKTINSHIAFLLIPNNKCASKYICFVLKS
jgi:hypothetical protein